MPIRRAIALPPTRALALAFLLAAAGCGQAARTEKAVAPGVASAAPATILIGQSWLGLWQDGKMIGHAEANGWQFNAARLSPDRAVLEIAAYPTDAATGGAANVSILRFDSHTLAMLGTTRDPAAAQWQPLSPPVGTDTPVRLDAPIAVPLAAGTTAVAANAATLLIAGPAGKDGTPLQVRGTGDGKAIGPPHRLPPGDWRATVSPEGSTVAAFAATPGKPWPGQVWDAVSGQAISAPGLSIDDGAERESGAARMIACLLPRGQGAILTYLGAPADRYSEYVPFGSHAAKPVRLDTPYITGCLTTGGAAAKR